MESNLMKVVMIACIALIKAPNGVAEDTGLSKFWADNYKAFHQIYGKTSDLDLYGQTLPLSVTHGIEAKKFKKSDALSTKHVQSFGTAADTSAAGTQVDPFEISDSFAQLLAKRKRTKNYPKNIPKATNYGTVFATDESIIHDQSAIDYLKQYQHLGTQQAIDFPQEGLSGFKPSGITFRNVKNQPPAIDSYRSIQDIIDASDNYEDAAFERQKANHELAHKIYDKIPKIQFEGVEKLPLKKQTRPNKPGVRFVHGNDISKKLSRGSCGSGRCRKPSAPLRLRKIIPRIRKIKHTILNL